MIKFKSYLIVLLVTFVSLSSYAQSNYLPGSIVSTSGDTISGVIDCKEWLQNPRKIRFKASNDSVSSLIAAPECRSVIVYGVCKFNAAIVNVSMNKVDLASLSTNPDTSIVRDNVFLKEELAGKKLNLYSYKDAVKVRYYLSYSGFIEELKNVPYLSSETETKVVRNDRIFLRQLYKIAVEEGVDVDAFSSKINNIEYNLKSLTKAINFINGEKSWHQPFAPKSNRKSLNFFVGGGVDITKLIYQQEKAVLGVDFEAKSEVNFNPLLKIGVESYFNATVKKSGLRLEASATILNTQIHHEIKSDARIVNTALNFRRSTLSISALTFMSVWHQLDFSIPVSVGLRGSFHNYKSATIKNEVDFLIESLVNDNSPKDYTTYSFTYDFPVNVGIRYKHLELFTSYNIQISTLDNNGTRSHLTSQNAQCGIIYHLNLHK